MEIKYLGHSSFRIKFKNGMVLLTDPFDPSYLGLPFAKQKCDLLTISHDHRDHNFLANLNGPVVRDEMFVVSEEGEYEVGGVEVTAIKSYHDKNKGRDRGENLISVVRYEGLTVCHLGDLGSVLSERMVDKIGPIDVLLVPVGGVFTIDAPEANKVISSLNPAIVIPMHFKVKGLSSEFDQLGKIDRFLSTTNLEVMLKDVNKVKVELNSLPENTKVVLLDVQS